MLFPISILLIVVTIRIISKTISLNPIKLYARILSGITFTISVILLFTSAICCLFIINRTTDVKGEYGKAVVAKSYIEQNELTVENIAVYEDAIKTIDGYNGKLDFEKKLISSNWTRIYSNPEWNNMKHINR